MSRVKAEALIPPQARAVILNTISMCESTGMLAARAAADLRERITGTDSDSDAWLTGDEVAKMARVSRFTVRNWRRAGKLPYARINGRVFRYRRSDVDAMLNGEG